MQPPPSKRQNSGKRARSQVVDYHTIKKALLSQHHSRCAKCYRKTIPVRLARVRQKKGCLAEDGYCLLCHDCILARQEKRKQEKKRLWRKKPGKRKISKGGFWNKIRPKVLERDNYTCVWCGGKEKQKLGLGSLIPLSRGGKLTFDNFVCACWRCRPAKGSLLPLEYIWRDIDIDEFLHEELDYALRVKDPGKNVSIRFFLFAELSQFLHRLTNDAGIPSRTRSRAELLNVKLLS